MTPILAKLDELKALADKAPPWLGKFQDPSRAAVLVTVDADDFRQMLKMCTAMPQLVEALRVALVGLTDEDNHWHHPNEPGPECSDWNGGRRCTACDSLTRIQAILEAK